MLQWEETYDKRDNKKNILDGDKCYEKSEQGKRIEALIGGRDTFPEEMAFEQRPEAREEAAQEAIWGRGSSICKVNSTQTFGSTHFNLGKAD